jgi:hypothetical protein
MNYLLSPLAIDEANTVPSAYWTSICLRLILSVDLLPQSLSKLVAGTRSPEAGQCANAVTVLRQPRLLLVATR